jgi:hypothetical protein
MNFNQLVEQELKRDWILIITWDPKSDIDDRVKYYTLKKVENLNNKEKEKIKHLQLFGGFGDPDLKVFSNENDIIIFYSSLTKLQGVLKMYEDSNKMVQNLNLDKDTEQHWGGVIDGL